MPPRWLWLAAIAASALLLLTPAGTLWMLRHPPRTEGAITPEDLGLATEHRRLTTSDDIELDAWLVEARNDTSTAIVVAHGYPAHKADVLPLAAPLAEDHHLVLFDHRGLGASEGQTTLGIHEPRDVRAAIAAARSVDGVERVGVLGFSMGGAAAIQAAAEDPDVDALVTQAAYADLDALAAGAFPAGPLSGLLGWIMLGYAQLVGLDADQARPVDAIDDVRAPILLVHGDADETVPPDHGRRLAEAAGTDAELWIVDGAGHAEASAHPDWTERVSTFFARNLG